MTKAAVGHSWPLSHVRDETEGASSSMIGARDNRINRAPPRRLADRLCVGSFIARIPFATAYTKFSKFGGAQAGMGPLWLPRREEAFLQVQGERLAPGRDRSHLPVGQPLASDCRSIADWDPYFGLMRFRPLRTRGRRGEGRARP